MMKKGWTGAVRAELTAASCGAEEQKQLEVSNRVAAVVVYKVYEKVIEGFSDSHWNKRSDKYETLKLTAEHLSKRTKTNFQGIFLLQKKSCKIIAHPLLFNKMLKMLLLADVRMQIQTNKRMSE